MEELNQQNGIENTSSLLSNGCRVNNPATDILSFEQNSTTSTTSTSTTTSTTTTTMDQVLDALKSTAAHISKTALSSTIVSDLVKDSNSSQIHEELETILSQNFYPHNLNSLHSVIVFLLLNYFLFKKELEEENEVAKGVSEDRLSLLREKNSELEEESSSGSKLMSSSSHCSSCVDLRESLDVLSNQFDGLQRSYEEICHINEQWALDYETLTKQISNTTGFHSVATSNSTHSTSSSCTHHGPLLLPNYASPSTAPPACIRCPIYELEVKDKNQEIEDLSAIIVGLREDIKESKERLNQKQRELLSLESDYQAIRMQIQELGDLQQTMTMKKEYRTMQRSLQHKTKQYQEAMCEKMELQKQIEKLRQAFLKFFPNSYSSSTSTSQPQTVSSSSSHVHHSGGMSGGGSSGECISGGSNGGYYSFPLHSCRQNIQSYPVNTNPPTPPGLLARGDFRGTQVEKDENSVPKIYLESRGQLSDSNAPHFSSWPKQAAPTRAGPGGTSSAPSSSSRPHILSSLDSVSMTRGGNMAAMKMTSSSSGDLNYRTNGMKSLDTMSQSHSTGSVNPMFQFPVHGNTNNNHYHHVHAPTTMVTSNGSTTSSIPHSTTTISTPYYNTSMSSLGYGSSGETTMDRRNIISPTPNTNNNNHTPDHTPRIPRSKSSLDTYSYYEEFNGKMTAPRSLSHESIVRPFVPNEGQLRPNKLALGRGMGSGGGGGGGSEGSLVAVTKQQSFSCPNCRKVFFSRYQDSFEPWFEHMKNCTSSS